MTHEQFTEELYKQYRSPEEAAIALTATLKFHCDAKQKLDDTLVYTCIQGGNAIEEVDKKMYSSDSIIEETARHLEELKEYNVVGYPQCIHTNASSVLDAYNEKIQAYKDNHNAGDLFVGNGHYE